jgi:HlyD family secretion protein
VSKANPNVDLESLSRPAVASPSRRPRRRWVFLALPLLLLAGFLAVLASSLGDWFSGAMEVEIVRPAPVVGGHAGPAPGTVAVRAAGWIEPDPFAISVSALAPGVVREVLVQQSDEVQAGAPIALLIDDDARLGVRQTQAALAEAGAEVARTEAELAAARASYDAALLVNERAATTEADLDGRRAEAEQRDQAVLEARAQLSAGESEVEVQRHLAEAGAAGPRAVELAEAALAGMRAEVATLQADAALAHAQARAAEAVLKRACRDLELRIEDKLRLATAEADVTLAQAALARTQATHDEAQLRLERMTVRAPAAGLVLQRFVTPGTQLTPENAVVATLYDPRSVRVRVDVPQQEIGKLGVGQQVLVEADARPGRDYHGEVSRIVRQADINKVTLQAHVRITDGDELLRPEMLVQTRFLADAPEASDGSAPAAGGPAAGGGAVRIPARLVVDGSRVWVLDAHGKAAELREVRLGGTVGDDVEVLAGLNLSDKLIASHFEHLAPGLPVKALAARTER